MFKKIIGNRALIRGVKTKNDHYHFSSTNTLHSKIFAPVTTINEKKNIHNPEHLNKIEKIEKKDTLIQQIDKDAGLRDYLTDIYKKSGYGFGTSLCIGTMAPLVMMGLGIASIAPALWIANIPLGFYSVYKITKLESKTIYKDNKFIETENSEKNKWYNVFSVSNGITISPAIFYSFAISPTVMPIALACTGGVFAASTMYALKKKDLSFVQYQGPLIGCVGGLICSGFVQLVMMGFGYHNASWMLGMGTSVLSTGIFSALIAVDTHMAIKSYKNKQLDSTGIALSVLLDITNLFLDLLKIIGELTKAFKD